MDADIEERSFRDDIKFIRLSSVPRKIQWRLAWHLDSPLHSANWKSLSETCGLRNPMIMSIEDRVCHTREKSCTLLLFDECLIPRKITIAQLVTAFAIIKNLACIQVLKDAFHNGDLRTSNKKKTNAMQQQSCSLPAAIDVNGNENVENPAKKIFITYSEDSREMAKLIYRWLKQQGCIVSLDIYESRQLQENKIVWYDKTFKEADHVLILVSPQYAEDISERGTSDLSPVTLYLHSRMQAEYLKNYCTNKRFMPIVLPGATKAQGPEWLMYNTISYDWPAHHRDVFRRIHDQHTSTSARLQETPIVKKSRT
jgi:hypothetical protein